mmetsp:Transcript_65050/g.163957  ORF Transcript_65050/g.163957 Transcript_65050/m.163957 type:complete len:255 (+) Transcript_65050:358-1122(+)
MGEDDEPLLTALVEGHEHVSACLLLHAPQLATAVAGHPTFAILRDVHLRCVVTLPHVGDRNTASTLLQQPAQELPAPFPLLQGPSNEGDMSHVLHDGTSSTLEFLASGALLSEGVTQLIVPEEHAVGVESLFVACLLAEAFGEVAWVLCLHTAHDLQFCASAAPLRTEDDKLLASAPALLLSPVHEEHEHTPLLLHGAKRGTPRAGDVTNTITGNVDHGAVIPLLPAIDVHRTLELVEEPLHVFFGFPACLLGA